MFILEYIRKKNFIRKNKRSKNIGNVEELELLKFKEEIADELANIMINGNKKENE